MIQLKKISKSYNKQLVINEIDLLVEKGQIYSLLGKNGAGKTTIINLILDLIKPDSGEILIDGYNNNTLDKTQKSKIGVVGENLALLEELNGMEFLLFIGKIYNIPKSDLINRIDDLFNYFFDNEKDKKKSISKYSTGMKKKIAFCAAVLNTPDILILDEPFAGLDPLAANLMLSFLKKYQKDNRLFFISSHELGYVEKIATHIGVLDEGRLAFNSTLHDFTENGEKGLNSALLSLLKPDETELGKMDWV